MRHMIFAFCIGALISVAPLIAGNETAQNDVAVPADPDQKIKCRKVEVSGSLIKKGRVCKTIAEWKAIQSNGNRTARAIVESGQICAGQCGGN